MLLDVERERLEVRRHDHDDVVFPIRPSDGKYVCVEPVERFADACLAKEVENDGPDKVGVRAVEIIDTVYHSAESGKPEEV
jgi:hypothetical protein